MVKIGRTETCGASHDSSHATLLMDLQFLTDNNADSLTSESRGDDSYKTHQSHDPENRVHRADKETTDARRS